ncbi:MAG: sensor of ECF-type sigma factor [Bacteroidota bacterium]
MMKRLIIPVLVLVFSFNATAQRGNQEQIKERIKAQKIAFITERLNLSTEEAQQFWPIYNAFETKTEEFRKNDLREVRQAMRRGNLSDKEAQDILDKFMAVEDKLHEAKKQLVRDLRSVIPPQKIIALKTAEDAFKNKLLEILQKRKARMQQGLRNKN